VALAVPVEELEPDGAGIAAGSALARLRSESELPLDALHNGR